MQRPNNSPSQKKGEWHCPDSEWLSLYPVLSQGMSDRWWDDGKPREPWYLSIKFQTDGVQISLVDPGLQQSLYTTADGVTEGLAALEAIVSGGSSSWRRWKGK